MIRYENVFSNFEHEKSNIFFSKMNSVKNKEQELYMRIFWSHKVSGQRY